MTNFPQAERPLLSSPAYKQVDSDPDFLQRDELRAVRLQLEWLKPELTQQDEGIESTIVVFGSARLLEPATAKAKLLIAEKDLAASPEDPEKNRALAIAKSQLTLSPYYQEAREFGRLVSSVVRLMDIANSSSSPEAVPALWKQLIEGQRMSGPNQSDSILSYRMNSCPILTLLPHCVFNSVTLPFGKCISSIGQKPWWSFPEVLGP